MVGRWVRRAERAAGARALRGRAGRRWARAGALERANAQARAARWQAGALQVGGTGARGTRQAGRGSARGVPRPLRHGGPGHETARPPTTRPRAHSLGVACARRLGQLFARATGLVFDLVFQLGSVSESPFGPGS